MISKIIDKLSRPDILLISLISQALRSDIRKRIETYYCLAKNGSLRSCRLGRGVWIMHKATIKGDIEIGDDTIIHNYAVLDTYGGKIKLGSRCSVNPFSVLYGHGGLSIGNYVRIAAHTVIVPFDHIFDSVEIPIGDQGRSTLGIKIDGDVWIGANVTVTDGVTIGQGCVVGAGSVVVKDIPEFSVAAGVPAKVIKKRK